MYVSIITTILISLSCPQSEKGSSCDTGRDHLFPEGENNELQIECIKYTINKRTCKSDKNTHHSQTGLNRYESKIYHRRLRYTPALLFTMMAVTRVIPRPLLVTVLAAAGVVSVLTLAWRFVWRLVWGLVWWLVWRFVWRFVGWSVLAGGENRHEYCEQPSMTQDVPFHKTEFEKSATYQHTYPSCFEDLCLLKK